MCRNTAFDEFKPACPGFRLNSGPPLLPVAPRKIRMEAVSVTSCGSFPLRVQAFVALGLSYFRFAAIYAAPEAELSSKLEPRIKKKAAGNPCGLACNLFPLRVQAPVVLGLPYFRLAAICCASAELSSELGRTYKNPQDFSCG